MNKSVVVELTRDQAGLLLDLLGDDYNDGSLIDELCDVYEALHEVLYKEEKDE